MFTEHEEIGVAYGCIFCKTGQEKALASELEHKEKMKVLVAQKRIRRRLENVMVDDIAILFPGYVFFKTHNCFDASMLRHYPYVIKLLTNGENDWRLIGEDYRFAVWLFSQGAYIDFSQAMIVGDRLKIIKGPLMGYDGQIIKINRRFQSCLVLLRFEHREYRVWLGYELIERRGLLDIC